ncbi:MAG: ATP-binding protein [Chloroflexi bacterium]|nr:ATP-binding protein [Chloroflexota bacterium]
MLRLKRRQPSSNAAQPLTPEERRFALGTRSLADLVAPAVVEVTRDHLRLEYQFARVLAVTRYPRSVSPGWLAPLVEFEHPLELSLHIHPLETAVIAKLLGHKMVQLQSSRLVDLRGGRLADPEREVAFEDAERLRDALQRGEERVFSVSLYILVRAASPRILDDLTRRVETTLDGMLAHSRVAILEQERGFRACLPIANDSLLVYRNLDTSSLATTFPFASSSLSMERGVLYGVAARSQSPVIVDPFDASLENANMAVFAMAGAGKSYFVKLMALRNLLAGVEFLIIDPEDEYRALCQAAGGQYVRLAGSSGQHVNPFDVPPAPPRDVAEGVDPLAEQVMAMLGLLEVMLAEPGTSLGQHERNLLDRALYQTYARAGITSDISTHSRPAPLLVDLHAVLQETPGDLAMSLAIRLSRYVSGSLAGGLFAAPTDVELNRRLVVFNIQMLEEELRPLAIHLIANFVWKQVRRERRARLLVIDEAWSLLRYPEGGAFVSGMARRARKYYLGLVTITQDVADFLRSEHGRAVLVNAAMKLLLKQDATTVDVVADAFQLAAEERQYLLGAQKGEGLLFARGARLPLVVESSPAEHRLVTTAPRELFDVGEPPGTNGVIRAPGH